MEDLTGKKVVYPMINSQNGFIIHEEGEVEKQWEAGIKILVKMKDKETVVSADICKVIDGGSSSIGRV